MGTLKYKTKATNKGCLGLSMIPLLIWIYGIGAWIVNLIILLGCDFAEPWRDEIIHAIGLIGPAAMITVWF